MLRLISFTLLLTSCVTKSLVGYEPKSSVTNETNYKCYRGYTRYVEKYCSSPELQEDETVTCTRVAQQWVRECCKRKGASPECVSDILGTR